MPYISTRSGAILTVDLAALRQNYRFLKSQLSSAVCGAAVKADAYGLGAEQVAAALYQEGCRDFFVAHLQEAISLRKTLANDARLIVMHGAPSGYEREFLEYACTPVLNSLEQMAAWRKVAASEGRTLDALVQVDTGMARMGLSDSEIQRWLSEPELMQGINMTYLMSHLSVAENQTHFMNERQLGKLNLIRQHFPECKTSFANSSGIFLGANYQFDLVRPGAALYGITPVNGKPNPMQAVAMLQGRIVQTREIGVDIGVGYGGTWRSQRVSRIATVAVGYADGWMRSLSNRGIAWIAGQKVPMVGNVSMDTLTLDVTDVPAEHLQEGSYVDLLSADYTVNDVAAAANTIGYEILTSLGARYERIYRN